MSTSDELRAAGDAAGMRNFERPIVDLEDAPLQAVKRYMRLTDSLFAAFGWKSRPPTRIGYFRWDAPSDDGCGAGKAVFADVYQETACVVGFHEDGGIGDLECCANDLQVLAKLITLHRNYGIGTIDAGKLVEAIRGLTLQASGYDPESMSIETFAALVGLWELQCDLADATAGRA